MIFIAREELVTLCDQVERALDLLPSTTQGQDARVELSHTLGRLRGHLTLEDRPTEPRLSAQERRLMRLIAEGASNEDISREMGLSINTVKSYVRSAYRKVGVRRRSEALIWALQNRQLHEPPTSSPDAAR